VRKSLASPDRIISMIDGKPYRTLRRHLSTHGLTPDEYRARYKLKPDYPMVAPAYSEARRAMAKKIGLGRKPNTGRDDRGVGRAGAQAPPREGRRHAGLIADGGRERAIGRLVVAPRHAPTGSAARSSRSSDQGSSSGGRLPDRSANPGPGIEVCSQLIGGAHRRDRAAADVGEARRRVGSAPGFPPCREEVSDVRVRCSIAPGCAERRCIGNILDFGRGSAKARMPVALGGSVSQPRPARP
jgi:hypothetical protein